MAWRRGEAERDSFTRKPWPGSGREEQCGCLRQVWTSVCVCGQAAGRRSSSSWRGLQGKWGSGGQRASVGIEGVVAERLVKWFKHGHEFVYFKEVFLHNAISMYMPYC